MVDLNQVQVMMRSTNV